jgi:intracellular sulfur oxidation DsrE/DsrF family protein
MRPTEATETQDALRRTACYLSARDAPAISIVASGQAAEFCIMSPRRQRIAIRALKAEIIQMTSCSVVQCRLATACTRLRAARGCMKI